MIHLNSQPGIDRHQCGTRRWMTSLGSTEWTMRHLRTAIAISVGALLISGAAMAQPATSPGARAVKHGGGLARRYCSTCHATGSQGDSPFAAAPRFRELGRRYPLDDLQESLVEGIVSGHPAMPQYVFTAASADDLIAYLKSIQTVQTPRSGPSASPHAR